MRARRGFTLMEMLIVTAVIAILVAIAIPTFTASLEKARSAACAANRRSLKGLLTTAWMLDGKDGREGVEATYQAQGGNFTCPDGGKISYQLMANGQVVVSCSRHAPTGASTAEEYLSLLSGISNIAVSKLSDKNLNKTYADLAAYFRAYLQYKNRTSGSIDSEADSSVAPVAGQVRTYLETEYPGVDFTSGSWRIYYQDTNRDGTPEQYYYLWSSTNVAKLTAGTAVTVTRYDVLTKAYEQTDKATVSSLTVSGRSYRILSLDKVSSGDWTAVS